MPKPIRRSDRQNRDFLRRFFASKRGQEVLRGPQVEADTPFPGVQLLPEAEVYGAPTQYEEADLAGSVLRGGALATREALGLVPIAGEALDVAEFDKIRRTGKDFYGEDADPTTYAGLTAAGMLLPNIIERPARALARGAKKFFKFGKKVPEGFQSRLNRLDGREYSTFKNIYKSDFIDQAKIDMDLHDQAMSNPNWTDSQKQFLMDDKKLKQRFIDIIEAGGGERSDIQRVIDGLKDDQKIHRDYMSRIVLGEPGEKRAIERNAGSWAWHDNWVNVYDGWIDELQRMKNAAPLKDSDTSILPIRKPDSKDTKGLSAYSDQTGVQFVRDWYRNPRVREHFREVAGSGFTGRNRELFNQAFDEYNKAVGSQVQELVVDGKVKYRSSDPVIDKIFDQINSIEKKILPSKNPDRPEDFTLGYTQEQSDQLLDLWNQVAERRWEVGAGVVKDLEKKYGKEVVDQLESAARPLNAEFDVYPTFGSKPAVDYERQLEDVFERGRTTPDILADFVDDDLKRVVPKDAGGVSNAKVTAVSVLDKEGKELSSESLKRYARLTGAHEANHDATVAFLRSASPQAKKIRFGLAASVKPEFKELVEKGTHRGLDDGDEYYASVAELTARAAEMRFNLIEAVTSPNQSQEQMLRAAFNGRLPDEDEVLDFLIGNHDKYNAYQTNLLTSLAVGDSKSSLKKVYDDILGGKGYGKEKKEAFRNFMKYSLMGGVAAGAYGSMDDQGQAPTGMSQGGMITMKKKRGGMSVIRK